MARTIPREILPAAIRPALTVAVPTVAIDRHIVVTILRIGVPVPRIAERSRRPPADTADRTPGIRPTAAPVTVSARRLIVLLQIDRAGTAIARQAVGPPGTVNDRVEIGKIGTGHRTSDFATT